MPGLKTLGLADSAALLSDVIVPTIAKGVILRRPFMVGAAARLGLDRRAVRRMQALRARYGEGPVFVRNPVRPQILVLGAEDVADVLHATPDPFSPASSEKRAALSHFEPNVSLISAGSDRVRRRAFQDEVLQSSCPVHDFAASFAEVVGQEVDDLLRHAEPLGELDWRLFSASWMRIVRRTIFGDPAREDTELTDMAARLRARANWAFAAPRNRAMRRRFHERIRAHMASAPPGSLASLARQHTQDGIFPEDQMSQWLFAFDPAGISTFRALALLSSHPDMLGQSEKTDAARRLDWLRAAMTETIRLYPTTPMILRQTERAMDWRGARIPAGTGIMIYTPFFHRDSERRENADRFRPDTWLGVDPAEAVPLVPFSAGSGACPARHIVTLLGAQALDRWLQTGISLVNDPGLDPARPLPATLDHTRLRFAVG